MFALIGIVATNLTAAVGVPTVLSAVGGLKRVGKQRDRRVCNDRNTDRAICEKVHHTRSQIRRTDRTSTRLIEIEAVENESEDTKSFYFRSLDGTLLGSYRPGQHLIVERPASGNRNAEQRCYTLSLAPNRNRWRITIRRQAPLDNPQSFSAWAHREWRVGDQLRVRGPRGSFVLDKADPSKPLVLLSAGVGITPTLSMLQEELSYPRTRSKWLFHQVRDLANAPLVAELISEVEGSENCRAFIAASQMTTTPRYASKNVQLVPGKLDLADVVTRVGTTDFNAFLCGPAPWMKAVRSALVSTGVPDSQVWDESFGGAESELTPPQTGENPSIQSASPAFEVAFEASGKRATFDGTQSTILSQARSAGVSIPASCRAGHCGTCAVKLLRGKVSYLREPETQPASDEILPCICRPESDIAIHA